MNRTTLLLLSAVALRGCAAPAAGQEHPHDHLATPAPAMGEPWRLGVMGQVFPILSLAEPFDPDAWLHDREASLTQPALMDLSSPDRRFALLGATGLRRGVAACELRSHLDSESSSCVVRP